MESGTAGKDLTCKNTTGKRVKWFQLHCNLAIFPSRSESESADLNLWSLAQESYGPVGVGPEEGHKNDHKDGTPLLCGKDERVGVVQPGQEKAPGRPFSSLPVPEGGLQER